MPVAIYCHPNKATQSVITVEKTLTRTQVATIRDYYDAKEMWYTTVGGAIASILLAPTNVAFSFLGGLTSAFFTNVIVENLVQEDNNIDNLLINSTQTTFTVVCTYKYRRHGSNDGAYFLTYIDFQ